MKKSKYYILGLAIILVIIGIIFFPKSPDISKGSGGGNSGGGTPIVFGVAEAKDYENFEAIIKNNQMIQDLPDDAVLTLSFYSFNTGEREWERNYILTKGNVEEGTAEEADIKLIMASKYLTILKTNNLCGVIQLSQNKGDFASETELSSFSLAWKFKSMKEYKDCLGM